jgi:predicted dehydrogenase
MMSSLSTNYAHAQAKGTIRIGLVGCGGRGRGAAVDCIKSAPGVTLAAMGDLLPDHMEMTRKLFDEKNDPAFKVPADKCFVGWDAYQQVLASDIDLVILATPPGFRPMMIKAAIAAGKHVFAEKPIAVDPSGVRTVLAAAEEATKKSLGLVVGTQRRHQPSYIETIKRIHDGAIGKVVALQGYWTQGGAWMVKREPGWSDMEWQVRNWMYFVWLAGDIIVEQHMHQIDVANWVMGGPPKYCIGMGGRQVRIAPEYGHIYDHFAVEYEYRNGAKFLSMCRQIDKAYSRIGEFVVGTKGTSIPASKIEGENAWAFDGDNGNPYVNEHTDLIKSIRDGKPLNEGKQAAESTLTAIMGRLSAYTGMLVTWAMAMESKLDLMPKNLAFGPLPVAPVAMPGKDPWV